MAAGSAWLTVRASTAIPRGVVRELGVGLASAVIGSVAVSLLQLPVAGIALAVLTGVESIG